MFVYGRKKLNDIQRSLTDYLVLYPLEAFRSHTYEFAEDVVILQATDLSAWEQMSANFDSTFDFTPSLGTNFGCPYPKVHLTPF